MVSCELRIDGSLPTFADSQLTILNSRFLSVVLEARDGDLQLFLPLVGNPREGHLEKAVLHLRRGPMRVDRVWERDRLDKRSEVPLHAEEADPFAGANPALLVSSHRQHPPA